MTLLTLSLVLQHFCFPSSSSSSSLVFFSLSQVDKRVTTPYWDFTIEGEAIYQAGWGPKALVHVSNMFTDTW